MRSSRGDDFTQWYSYVEVRREGCIMYYKQWLIFHRYHKTCLFVIAVNFKGVQLGGKFTHIVHSWGLREATILLGDIARGASWRMYHVLQQWLIFHRSIREVFKRRCPNLTGITLNTSSYGRSHLFSFDLPRSAHPGEEVPSAFTSTKGSNNYEIIYKVMMHWHPIDVFESPSQ